MTEDATEPAVDPEPDTLADELEPDADLTPDDELEPEPVDDPDPGGEDQEASSQKIMRDLEREHTRHEKAVAKALGVSTADMHLCPSCEGVGFTPEPLDKPSELVQDPYTETCERCKGNGEVLSGATQRGLYAIPCNGCGGSGYVTKPEQPAAGQDFGNGANSITSPPISAIVSPADDAAIAALRARGYMVMEPISVPPAAVA